jgi:hypothetical protein
MGKAGQGTRGGPYIMRRKITRQFLILLMLFPAAARAEMPEGLPAEVGNLPLGFYPEPSCVQPDKEKVVGSPIVADPQVNQIDHNLKVGQFNKGVTAFNGCVKTYIDNSRYDIERILGTVNTAVAEARGTAPPLQPVANGNLPADFYPRSSCVKPDQGTLGAQPAPTDLKAMTGYNLKVKAFNQLAVTFNACLKTYQGKAQHDIREIQAAAQAVAGTALEK